MLAEGPFHFSYIYLHKYFYNFSKFIHYTILILIFNQLKLQKFWVTEPTGVQLDYVGEGKVLTFSTLESLSMSVTLCICMPLPFITIDVVISMFLPSAMTNHTKMIVAAGSKLQGQLFFEQLGDHIQGRQEHSEPASSDGILLCG